LSSVKAISDLKNYNDVLDNVAVGEPVFLTENGRERYALIDLQEYEKMRATISLLSELAKAEKSALEEGWCTIEEIKDSLGITNE